jgi:predicted ferric reductase
MNKNKIIFYTGWVALILLGVFTVFQNTQLSLVLVNRVVLANFIQRILGLTAFTMMFTQLILGAYMPKWVEKYGPWVFKFHVFHGILIYSIILLHPLFFVFGNYFAGQKFNPFFAFIDVCVLCSKKIDFYYNFGRIAFWLTTAGVFAGIFRAATPFMRVNWRKFHILNYVAFLAVGIHGFYLGTDFMARPFSIFAVPAFIVILAVIAVKSTRWPKH